MKKQPSNIWIWKMWSGKWTWRWFVKKQTVGKYEETQKNENSATPLFIKTEISAKQWTKQWAKQPTNPNLNAINLKRSLNFVYS